MTTLLYAGYSRVSLDEQRKGISPEDQMRRIHEWARYQSVPFQLARYSGQDGETNDAEFYEDYTGFEYERPEMDILRQLAKEGRINALIVLRTDRFARDEAVYMLLERFFKKHGVRLFSVEEGEFTPGSVNKYLAAFHRARAEDEAESLKKRMKQARHAYLKSGVPQSQGQALFGYSKQGTKRETTYLIHEEQAAVVRLIYHLYIHEQLSVNQIAQQLNKDNTPAPAAAKGWKTSGKWMDETVRRILKNPGYKGLLAGYQTKMIDGENLPTDPSERIEIKIPAIIDDDTWNQAQYLLAQRTAQWAHRKKTRDYLLSGMITCICGHAMVGEVEKPRGKFYHYYRCNSHDKPLAPYPCNHKRIPALGSEETVWDFLQRLATDTQTAMALYENEQAKTEAALSETVQRIQVTDELLEENTEERKRLNWMFQKKRCNKEYFEAEWMRLESEYEALMRERQKSERVLQSQQATSRQFEELEAIGRELKEATEEATFEKKRRTLERLRTHITVEGADGDGVRWIVVEVLGYRQRVSLKKQFPCRPPRPTEACAAPAPPPTIQSAPPD